MAFLKMAGWNALLPRLQHRRVSGESARVVPSGVVGEWGGKYILKYSMGGPGIGSTMVMINSGYGVRPKYLESRGDCH